MKKLNELNLAELESLYRLLNEGIIPDEYSTSQIKAEARGFQRGHEIWKEKLDERQKKLGKIRMAIFNKVKEINF